MTQTSHSSQKIPKLRFREFQGEWKMAKLGEDSDIFDGIHQTPKYTTSGIPFVSVENIADIKGTKKFISSEDFKKNFKIVPQIGDILMTRITAGVIGATSVIKDNNPLAYYVSLALIRINNKDLDCFYLNYLINSGVFKKELQKRIIHSAFPKKINLGDIGKCSIVYPSFSEQQKIASFLSSVDTRIEQLQEKKLLLEEYKKGVMQKIFAREIRFKDENGKEYGEWEERKLGEIALITTGSSNREDSNLDGQYAFFDRSQDIRSSNQYLFDTEAIIVPGEGQAFIPKYFIGKFDLHQRTYAIMNFDNQDGKFLYYSIGYNSKHLLSHAVGSTVKSLRLPMFQKMPILLPTLPEQQKIASFLSEIDSKIRSNIEQLEEAEKWKKGLLQGMFV